MIDEREKTDLLLKGKKRALRLLERKDYSRMELKDRLLKDGYEQETVEQIIDYLDGFHYLDDVRVAGNFIRSRKNNKSRKELEFLLKQKGIAEEEIDFAMEENYKNEDGVSQEEIAIKRQLEKYHVEEFTLEDMSYIEKQKVAAKLYRKGFEQEKIRKLLHM